MTDTITLPRAEAKTILRALRTFDAGAMIKAEQMLVAALAQQAEQVPATYQFRIRADWMNNWAEWVACNKEQHEMYLREPKLHDWNYETRALYAAVPKGGV